MTDDTIAVCRGIDIGRNLLPSNVNRLSYAENDDFDRNLSKSMRGGRQTDVITVGFSGVQLSRDQIGAFNDVRPDTKRIMVWLERVDSTGGKVVFCSRALDGSLQSFSVLSAILSSVLDMLNAWTLYDPAKNYSARVITGPQQGAAPTPVVAVEFIRRARVRGDLTCAWKP